MSKKSKIKSKGVFFPNLNGLRFLAAFLVIVHHIEQLKPLSLGIINSPMDPFVHIIGKLGVILFFVLSGFLITYLLLAEESETGSIHLGKFYIRRVLRIWPLYFLIFIVSLFILPHFDFFALPGYSREMVLSMPGLKAFLYVFFMPLLVWLILGGVPFAIHLWSVGTEEHFYLFWPVLLKIVKKRRLLLMSSVIIVYLLILTFLDLASQSANKSVLYCFWAMSNIDCMAIGAIYALLLFRGSRSLEILMNKYLFYGVTVLVLFLILNATTFSLYTYEIYAPMFGLIILNFAANKNIKISLENSVFRYLGKISYGLYMYHPFIVFLCLKLCFMMHVTSAYIVYPVCISVTIAVSALSYKYFESPFLRMKDRFSEIKSNRETVSG